MEKNEELSPTARFVGLIKQKRNDEVKSILLNALALGKIKMGESPLVHAAIMHNNIELIAISFSFGFDINLRDSSEQITPLLMAARINSYRAVQLLLDLDAEVFVDDVRGENAFQVLMNKQKNTPAYIIGCLSERLKRGAVNPNKIINELVKIDCPLENVLKLNNALVMQEMLKLTIKIDRATSYALLERAMHSEDMNNVRVLLHHGPDAAARRERFVERVTDYIFNLITRPFFEQIFNWELIDEKSLSAVEKYFFCGNEKAVQLLLDMGFERYCKEKFGFDVIVNLFGNRNIDIVKVMRNRQFDIINSRDRNGNSALHVATLRMNKRAVAYLLDNGADPNVKNKKGQTPLFYTFHNKEITEILLEAGADIQAMSDNHPSLVVDDFFIAHLMIAKARGIPIIVPMNVLKQQMVVPYEYDMYDIRTQDKLEDKCELHSLQLEWMKTRWVSETITLFFVLTENFECLARHVKDEKTYEEISKAIEERSLKPTYENMLKKNLKRARQMNELRVKAGLFLSEKMKIASDDHLAIRKIVGLLTYKDLLVFDELEGADENADESAETEEDDDYIWWKKQ